MTRVVTIKFRTAGKQYDFNARDFELKPGDKVIVETDRGRALGSVVLTPSELDGAAEKRELKNVTRQATEEDLQLAETNAAREETAFRYCRAKVIERQMEMKMVKAEYLFDGSKIIFYFTADGRVDFRELVKDLAHHFHTRIEMRQIGVRDEAKLVGGLGICGQSLCCCTFLTEFTPVSVKMAKEQNLALNPNKISGQCGRLLCCLSYEYDTYCKMRKGMPKNGMKMTVDGLNAYVFETDILGQKVGIRIADGRSLKMSIAEFKELQDSGGKLPEKAPVDELLSMPRVQPRVQPKEQRKVHEKPQQKPDEKGSTDQASDPPKRKRRRRRRKPGGGSGEGSNNPQQSSGDKGQTAGSSEPPPKQESNRGKPQQGDQPAQQDGSPPSGEQKKRRRRRRSNRNGPKPESLPTDPHLPGDHRNPIRRNGKDGRATAAAGQEI